MKHFTHFIWHRLYIVASWCLVSTVLSSCQETVYAPGKVRIEISPTEGSVIASKVPASLVISITDGSNQMVVENKQIPLTSQGGKLVSEAMELQPGTYKVSRLRVLDSDGKILYVDEQPSKPVFAVQANQLTKFLKVIGDATGTKQPKSKNINAKTIIQVFLHWAHIENDKFYGQVFVPDDSYVANGTTPEISYNENKKGYQSVSSTLLKYFPGYGAYYGWEVNFVDGTHLLEFYIAYAYLPAPDAVQIVYDGQDKPYVIDNNDDNFDPDPWAFGTAKIVVNSFPSQYHLIGQGNPINYTFDATGAWEVVVLNIGVPWEVKLHYDINGTFDDGTSFIKTGTIDMSNSLFIDGGPYRRFFPDFTDIPIGVTPKGIAKASMTMYADVTFDYGMGNKITFTDTNLGDYYVYQD